MHDPFVQTLGHTIHILPTHVIPAIEFYHVVVCIESDAADTASGLHNSAAPNLILTLFVPMALLIIVIAITPPSAGRRRRQRPLGGPPSLDRDNAVDEYDSPSLLLDCGSRHLLCTGVTIRSGLALIIVPLIVRFL